jgi:hypothetical protein
MLGGIINMMTTKFIIEMSHNRPSDTDLYYYRGQAGDEIAGLVPLFDYRKRLAKRYTFEHEAQHDRMILKAMHRKEDTLKVITIRCKI